MHSEPAPVNFCPLYPQRRSEKTRAVHNCGVCVAAAADNTAEAENAIGVAVIDVVADVDENAEVEDAISVAVVDVEPTVCNGYKDDVVRGVTTVEN
jgi:hypothetical protein